MTSKDNRVVIVVSIAIVTILIILLTLLMYGGEEEDGGPIRGEIGGDFTATGRIWSNESFDEHLMGITIYNGSGTGELRAMVTNVTSVTLLTPQYGNIGTRYTPEDHSFTIVSDFDLTSRATIVTWLEDYEMFIRYSNFNGSMEWEDDLDIDIEFDTLKGSGRIVDSPTKDYDIAVYDVTLLIENETIPLERGELNFPLDSAPVIDIDASGIGKLDHIPDVMVSGRVELLDFKEYRGLSRNVDRLTIQGERIRVRTIQKPYYFDEPYSPWIVEIEYSSSETVQRS